MMGGAGRRGFVERLFAEHGRSLQAYLHRRLRIKADVLDLAQEVYLRMLRVSEPEAIRNPQLYLYTVASNLMKEHAVLERRRGEPLDLDEAIVQQRLGELPALEEELESHQMRGRLNQALDELPAGWRNALILQYRYGLTYTQIADRLGVSSSMVKKYLAQGLSHCRRHLGRWE